MSRFVTSLLALFIVQFVTNYVIWSSTVKCPTVTTLIPVGRAEHGRKISLCMYVCTYIRMYVRTYVRTYVRMYVRTYVCMYVCMYVRMYVCTYVRMNVCMYVCIFYFYFIYGLLLAPLLYNSSTTSLFLSKYSYYTYCCN